MINCTQFSDAALAHVAGVHELDVHGCVQLADAAFVPLTRLKMLDTCETKQLTDAALAPLAGTLRELYMSYCPRITSAGVARLTQLQVLVISGCTQATLGDAAFVNLRNLRELWMGVQLYERLPGAAAGHPACTGYQQVHPVD